MYSSLAGNTGIAMTRPLSVYQSPAFVAFVMSCLCMYFVMTEATTTISGNEMDRLALGYFKNGINKDPIGGLRSWNSTIYFCDWNGVACDHQRQRVKVLNPSSLCQASSLLT
ncbi:uncharacterized protein A4U43_C02F120 [Asparagus officinalis]|uniref:Leucine-rich repeat-containing N-terminal plant-type domain-containing protein n=1 Tax=Asparagus officinalis TaxID=4686 RepID=A0A5P1FEL8_ASPOF|nr:uncharacterized protein A4U43_C02F120 [Asparagus officinalis]